MRPPILIYGSYGYTGALIAREAVHRRMPVVLAGRDQRKLADQADDLGCDYRVFGLDDVRMIRENLLDVVAVLNCAGPFLATAESMVKACLQAHAHYLDITGEIAVFERLVGEDDAARKMGVMIMPGVGFDVLPSDCLAAHLHGKLPQATRLELAIQVIGGVSHGTAVTALEGFALGGAVRREGRITRVPLAHRARTVDFGRGPRRVISVPWGDVATAYHTTGIPNIEVYLRLAPSAMAFSRAGRFLGWLLKKPRITRFLRSRIDAGPPGPDEAMRARGKALFWGEVSDDHGQSIEARLETPESYTLTVQSSLCIADKVLSGCAKTGFQTPAGAYGPELALELAGVSGFL